MSSNIRVNSITPSVGNSVAIGTAGGTVSFNNAAVVDVDGHTELDNVNISGVVTATSFVGPLTGDITGNIIGDVTGNITGVAATFSGNVSVAGVLTYEDVTNVDSIGIITARSGIHVTGGSVGIGTNPDVGYNSNTNGLVVRRGGANEGITIDSSNQGGLFFSNGTESGEFKGQLIYYHTPNNHYMGMIVDGSERLRITGIGSLGVGTQTPKTDVDISQKTGAVALPQGTTAQRPTGSAPYIRKNTTNNALEYYDGTSWVEIITDYFPTGSVILG